MNLAERLAQKYRHAETDYAIRKAVDEALEEAARKARAKQYETGTGNDWVEGYNDACRDIEAAIRGMKSGS